MATELPFEFQQRWGQVKKLLFPDGTNPEQEQGVYQLEQKDRDLEDHLASLSGDGTSTAQSFLGYHEAGFYFGNTGPGTHTFDLEIPVPSDTAFTYWVEWDAKFIYAQSLEAGARMELVGWAEWEDQSNGAGYIETNAFANSVAAVSDWLGSGTDYIAFGANNYPVISGSASRMTQMSIDVYGTSTTLRGHVTTHTTSGTYASTNYKGALIEAKVFALPV